MTAYVPRISPPRISPATSVGRDRAKNWMKTKAAVNITQAPNVFFRPNHSMLAEQSAILRGTKGCLRRPDLRICCVECTDNLSDRTTHQQTGLPWCTNNVTALKVVAKVALELRCGDELTEKLRIERSHDNSQREEDAPSYGLGIEFDRLDESKIVLLNGGNSCFLAANGSYDDIAFEDISVEASITRVIRLSVGGHGRGMIRSASSSRRS